MILKSFDVSSYRSCVKTNFPLQDNLTSLIGVNGSGKSNILNSILLLKKIGDERFRYNRYDSDLPFNKCVIKATFEHEKKVIMMHANIKLETDNHNNDSVVASEIKWSLSNFRNGDWLSVPFVMTDSFDDNFRYRMHIGSISRYKNEITKKTKESNDLFSLINDNSFKKEVMPLLRLCYNFFSDIKYYGATQFSDPAKCPVSIELEDNRLKRQMRFSSWHEQFIFDLYNAHREKSINYKRYISSINKDGLGLVNEINFKTLEIPSNTYKVQSGGNVNERYEKRILIVPIFVINGNNLSPNQLSEGTFKTLALLFYLLNDKSGLLLIEEPEVCIHHGLLNSLVSIIKSQSKNKQIIISTHSDYVLDSLKPENVLLVKYEEKKGTVVKPLIRTMSKNNFNALKDYLKNTGSLGEYWKEGGLL